MKRYELTYNKGETGVYCVSIVANPAVRAELMYFSDDTTPDFFQDEDQQVIYSVAMRPNMLIPRSNINGEPAMVFYSESTVRDLQQNFFKNGSNLGSTLDHSAKTDGVFAFESWIVADPAMDKATHMGLQVQKGDWVLGQKIEDRNIWDTQIKTGKLKGLSIEAFLDKKLITNTSYNMNEEQVRALFAEEMGKIKMAADLGTAYQSGDITIYAKTLELGSVVTDVKGAPMPSGTFTIAGVDYETDENGLIDSIETPEEETEEDAGTEEDATASTDTASTDTTDLQAQITKLQNENADLQAKLVKAEAASTKMSAENTALKTKTPAAAKIVPTHMAAENGKPLTVKEQIQKQIREQIQ